MSSLCIDPCASEKTWGRDAEGRREALPVAECGKAQFQEGSPWCPQSLLERRTTLPSHLKPARVCHDRPPPAHEPMQAARCRDHLRARLEQEVVGITKHQLQARGVRLSGRGKMISEDGCAVRHAWHHRIRRKGKRVKDTGNSISARTSGPPPSALHLSPPPRMLGCQRHRWAYGAARPGLLRWGSRE